MKHRGGFAFFCPLLATLTLLPAVTNAADVSRAPSLLAWWGRQGTEPGAFSGVMAIAVAPDGNVYVADGQARIQMFTADGDFVTIWGSRGPGDGQFQTPTGIAVDAAGNVYVLDTAVPRVQVFDARGRFLRKWGSRGCDAGEFYRPQKIAVDRDGNVFVVDAWNFRIQKFRTTGEFETEWGREGTAAGEFLGPVSIAVGSDGRVYVADWKAGGIQVFSSTGEYLERRVSAGMPKLPEPASDDPGMSVVKTCPADAEPGRRVVAAGKLGFGVPSVAASSCDSPLAKPGGIALDSDDNLYVISRACDRMEIYDRSGTHVGGWPIRDDPDLRFMEGMTEVAVARTGDVYVGELNGPRIWKFGHGPRRAERIAVEAVGTESLRTLDTLIAMPFGAAKPAGAGASDAGIHPVWSYSGFERDATLRSAKWDLELSKSTSTDSVLAAIADQIGRRLGEPDAPVGAAESLNARSFETDGVVLRTSIASRDGGGLRVGVERESPNVRIAATNADACDLRLLEGGLTEPAGSWEMLLRGLRVRWPDLADAIVTRKITEKSLLEAVQRAVRPDVSDADRDLVLLTADRWLNRLEKPVTLEEWSHLGFLTPEGLPKRYYTSYCGTILRSLASRVGQNEWADRAFLLLLDKGWVSDCNDFVYGDIYTPVLERGGQFLASTPDAALRASVALRVALAHETVLALTNEELESTDDGEKRSDAAEHRRRALELYRDLEHRTKDPMLARAISRRAQHLQQGGAGCKVYWIDGGC